MQPYELKPDPPEITQPLAFTENGRRFSVKHFLRVPTLADWIAYDAALRITIADVMTETGVGMAHRDNRTAALGMLWDRLALRMEGYGVQGNQEEWKAAVPFAHRIAAVTPRTLVVAAAPDPSRDSDGAEALYTPGLTPVHLLAAGGDYAPLIHWFRQPEPSQMIEFSRIHSERIYFRATRKEGAKAIIPALLGEYVKLYDALIESVEGYTVNGAVPLREQITQSMDAWHKQSALKAVFILPLEEEPEPEAA